PRLARPLRAAAGGVQSVGRVRDAEGCRRGGGSGRARGRDRVADVDPPRRSGRRLHVLGEGARGLALVRSDIWHRAQKVIPGGVSSPVRAMRSVGCDEPLFAARGHGAYLETADGRRLVDWVQSWGPLIFGHADPETVEAVRGAALDGTSFGASTEREVELAEEIVDAVPSIEQVRLVSSGTEAA